MWLLCGSLDVSEQLSQTGQLSRTGEAPETIGVGGAILAEGFEDCHSLPFAPARLREDSAGDSARVTGERPRASGQREGTKREETSCAKVARTAGERDGGTGES